MTVLALGIATNTKAQCDIELSNLVTTAGIPEQLLGPERCKYTFSATFDLTTNSGFKYVFFHTWFAQDYPALFDCGTGHTPNQSPGNVTQLGSIIYAANKSILDFGFIGLKEFLAANNTPGVKYPITGLIAQAPDYPNNDNNINETVALNTAASAFVTIDENDPSILHFEINDIEIEILGPCSDGGFPALITDVWGSNATGSQLGTSKSKIGAQCYVCGVPQSFNDPSISLTKICGSSPFQYDIGLSTESTTDIHVVYKLYAHDPSLGNVADPNTDPLLYTSPTITLSKNVPHNPDPIDLPNPYCCIDPWAQWDLYVQVTGQEFQNTVSTPLVNSTCATLPVNLKAFNAIRKNASIVELKWETAQEQSSKGFYVERKLSNGAWQIIDFVETKAVNGNSSLPITYEFSDANNSKGITQYRLRQLDIDGKQALSQIRAVRGEGQKGKTIIYPNPSGDGKVNIVFENVNSTRDVSLMDVSGKTLKQWKGVTNNNIQIDNLNAGFYSVRIVNNETGEQTVEKFIVNKR